MSTSTGAPAAFARSEGVKVLTKGTATQAPPTAPAAPATAIQVRRAGSLGLPGVKPVAEFEAGDMEVEFDISKPQ
jgi:hypothetical protein